VHEEREREKRRRIHEAAFSYSAKASFMESFIIEECEERNG